MNKQMIDEGYAAGSNNAEPYYGREYGRDVSAQSQMQTGMNSKRQPEIERYAEELASAIGGCISGLDTLESRLSALTRSDLPTATGVGAQLAEAVPQTGMGTKMKDMGVTARQVADRIQSLIRRLEV